DPDVAVLADGRFVVTWSDESAIDLDDPSARAIRQQIFDPRDGIVDGTEGGDVLFGHEQVSDEINGFGAGDTLQGLGGDDSLYGGDGNDVLIGGTGADLLSGGNG